MIFGPLNHSVEDMVSMTCFYNQDFFRCDFFITIQICCLFYSNEFQKGGNSI